jgi:hypothetical protein
MPDDTTNLPGETDLPRGRGTVRRRKAAAVLAAVTALAVGLILPFWKPWRSYPEAPVVEHFPEGALDGYLPEDARGVLTVNLRPLPAAPAARKQFRKPLEQLIGRGEGDHPWMGLLGVDPFTDLDRIRVVFCTRGPDRPLWLARGRFDPARFQTGPGKLRERVEDGFRVYEYTDPAGGRVTTLALAGDTLAASDDRARVYAALAYAAGSRKAVRVDPALVKLLGKVDRGQALWLAVSLDKLGHVGRLPSLGLELMLRPVLKHARSARGGVTCAEDVRAEFHFEARDEAGADDLETGLRSACETAAGASLLFRIEPDLLPLLRLLATGEVTRDGLEVRLRCRLTADQLGG